MLDRLASTPQPLALGAHHDYYHDQAAAAADLARQRYERRMINEAFAIAAGQSSAPPHIEHLRLLCELVAWQRARRPARIPF